MFEKLVSLLPYNPSLVHQLAFYGRRLRGEAVIRRTGLIFVALAFLVQFFAVISPPQSTVAASTNDLVNGGFSSAAEAANDCRSNVQGYGALLQNYGINCNTVAAASTTTINASSFNRQLYSMGRLPYGLPGEAPVNIDGGTFYIRFLWGWGNANYQALNVTSPGGQTFFLLYNCGNLTSIGQPVPVAQPPNLTISKTISPGNAPPGSSVTPGSTQSWRVVFNNTGGSAATNVMVNDPLPANTTFNSAGFAGTTNYGYNSGANATQWIWPSIPAGANNDYVDVRYTINPNTPSGTQICNVATITSSQTPPQTSNQVCFVVQKVPVKTCVYDSTIPATSSNCKVCPYDSTIGVTNSKCKVCPYDSTIGVTNSKCSACPYSNTITASNTSCKPCAASLSSQDTLACIVTHKTAANTTQGVGDANNTTAQASDEILYTLYAQNIGKATVKNYPFTENISDTLDYADVVNLYGGTINSMGQVSWPTVDIKAGATATEKILVKVKNPVPQTPQSSSDPMHFDLTMTNTYGNTINIKVPGSPAKTIETSSTTLVNTGPGTSLFVGAIILALTSFFFARTRLLARETAMAVQDNTSGGL